MRSYKKVIFFFIKLNFHKSSILRKFERVENKYYKFQCFGNVSTLDVDCIVANLYNSLKVFYKMRNCVNIFVVLDEEISTFSLPFFSSLFKNVFFIHRWISGFISNWQSLRQYLFKNRIVKQFFLKSRKLRFLRFFNTISQLRRKPDLIVLFGSSKQNFEIMRECFSSRIPVICFVDLDSILDKGTFKIFINVESFLGFWVLVQLLFSKGK